MIRRSVPLRLALIAVLGVSLSGCMGGLLGGGKPAQLYRFGQPAAAAAAPAAPSGGEVGVFRANSLFVQEAAGDRILAVTDGQAQYIAESRWVAPASVLWDQAVLAAFDAAPGRVRLISRGERGRADYVLRLDVRTFEARYENGPKAAPVVEVAVRAVMTRSSAPGLGPEKVFRASVPAASNRVSSIVAAYDQATRQVLGEIVGWTEGQVAGAAA